MKSVHDYPLLISAKIIADSISPKGVRLTTMEIVCHRYILAEFNTHRCFSRNSASSRAIPVDLTLERFLNQWAVPLEWPAEQPGMAGGTELEGRDLADAQDLFIDIHEFVGNRISDYLETHPDKSTRLHKSVLNRPMEFGQYHTIIVSSTDWDNYFKLRASSMAQPEIRAVAEQMKVIYDAGTPKRLKALEWHLPLYGFEGDEEATGYERVKLSVGRCARVSYLTHDGIRDLEADYALFDKLKQSGHWSPFEHAAQAQTGKTGSGNFRGFKQSRFFEENGVAPEQPKPPKPRKKKAAPAPFPIIVGKTYQGMVGPMGPSGYGNQIGGYNDPYGHYNSNLNYPYLPVVMDPKAYFSSPQLRKLMVLAASANEAQRALSEIEYDLMRDPKSWVNNYANSVVVYGRYPRLDWEFVSRSYAFRGMQECDLVVIKGWDQPSGSSFIHDEVQRACEMGIIKNMMYID